jgi:hypothetical protein
MEKLIFGACTRRLDVRIIAYTKGCLRLSSHTGLQYSITPWPRPGLEGLSSMASLPNYYSDIRVFRASRARAGQHSLERYAQAKPIDSGHAQRTWISESN